VLAALHKMEGGGIGVGGVTHPETGAIGVKRASEAGVVQAPISHVVVGDAHHRHRVGSGHAAS